MLLATTAGPNTALGQPFAEDTAGFGYFHSERHYRQLSAAIVKLLARGCTSLLVTSSTGADGDILARLLEGEKAQGYATALVCARPGMNFNALIHYYALWVGIAAEGDDGRMWSLLSHLMLERRRGITRVLIIEQAEALDAVCFDELLRFTQLDAPNIMPVVLLASPRFATQLESSSLGFLRGAIGARLVLERLDPEEVGPFLQYQINGSGNDRRLPDEAVATIAAQANGDPTVVNRLAREILGEPPLPDEESAPTPVTAVAEPPPTALLAEPAAVASPAEPPPASPLAQPPAALPLAERAAAPPAAEAPAASPVDAPTPATAAVEKVSVPEQARAKAPADDHARLIETARLLAPAEDGHLVADATEPDAGRIPRMAILLGGAGLAAAVLVGAIFDALLPGPPREAPVATIPIPPAPAPDAAETAPTAVAVSEPAPPVPPATVEPASDATQRGKADDGGGQAPALGSAAPDQPTGSLPAPSAKPTESAATPPAPAGPVEEKAGTPAPPVARVEPPPPVAPAEEPPPATAETGPPTPSVAAEPAAPAPAPSSPGVAAPPAASAAAEPPPQAAPPPAPIMPAPPEPPAQAAGPAASPAAANETAPPTAAPPTVTPAPPTPPTVTAALEPKAAPPAPIAAPPTSAQMALMLRRGDQLLAAGDIISARNFFERAASEGDAAALCGVGRSYDPLILRRIGVHGITGDAAAAIWWYRKAADAGSSEAVARLRQLSAAFPQSAQEQK